MLAIYCCLYGCAINQTPQSLYTVYSRYVNDVNHENISKVHQNYFSSALTKNIDIRDVGVLDQLIFNDLMIETINYFESIDNVRGCLSVNGYDKDNMPITFNLRYIETNHQWLIQEIEIQYIDLLKDQVKNATCPNTL